MLIKANGVNFSNLIHYSNLEIEADNVTFICGGSGCGKSTLLKLFNGVVSPISGEIMINGVSIEDFDTVELRKELLLVSQSTYLFDKTIAENFEEFYQYRDLPAPDKQSIQSFLTLCCAEFPLDANCSSMSGGERQRVYIAICISLMPKVLMLDEPTSALDSQTAVCLMKNLTAYCKENHMTLIVVSHDKALADRFADKVIQLGGGV